MKKFVAYNATTFEFEGFYDEGRKDMPSTVAEVNADTFLDDKGQHTHFNPTTNVFYTPPETIQQQQETQNRAWRDRILIETDKYVLLDFPITTQQKDEVVIYRQGLRDYPINWIKPTPPTFLNIT